MNTHKEGQEAVSRKGGATSVVAATSEQIQPGTLASAEALTLIKSIEIRLPVQDDGTVRLRREEVIPLLDGLRCRERFWCLSCGTVTRGSDCDCTEHADPASQRLVNYADQTYKEWQEAETRSPARVRALEPLAAADDKDWERLFGMLNDSGHGRFWRKRLTLLRAALKEGESHG